jgi:hypothetical protein
MMLNGLKNFAIDKVLRHVAGNKKLNGATNILALVPIILIAALNGGANWMLLLKCCEVPGSEVELVRVLGLVAVAALLWFCGKFKWLEQWLPVVEEVIEEAEKEVAVKPPVKD